MEKSEFKSGHCYSFFGSGVAALRIVAEIYKDGLSGFLLDFATLNFSHMCIFMFLFSVLVCIGVSLATNPPDYTRIAGLSFGTLSTEDRELTKKSVTTIDVALSLVLIAIVVFVLSYFTG